MRQPGGVDTHLELDRRVADMGPAVDFNDGSHQRNTLQEGPIRIAGLEADRLELLDEVIDGQGFAAGSGCSTLELVGSEYLGVPLDLFRCYRGDSGTNVRISGEIGRRPPNSGRHRWRKQRDREGAFENRPRRAHWVSVEEELVQVNPLRSVDSLTGC